MQFVKRLVEIGGRISIGKLRADGLIVFAVEVIHNVENHSVDQMHRAAVYVEQNKFAALNEFMNAIVDGNQLLRKKNSAMILIHGRKIFNEYPRGIIFLIDARRLGCRRCSWSCRRFGTRLDIRRNRPA